MGISYCQRWNFRRARAVDPLTDDEARARDAAGTPYTVIVGEHAAPQAILEVVGVNSHIGATFLDERNRQVLTYDFRRVDNDHMFMSSVTRWAYHNDRARTISEAVVIDTLAYREGGEVHRDLRDMQAHERTRTEFRDVLVDINWEPVPAFGDWGSIARRERSP